MSERPKNLNQSKTKTFVFRTTLSDNSSNININNVNINNVNIYNSNINNLTNQKIPTFHWNESCFERQNNHLKVQSFQSWNLENFLEVAAVPGTRLCESIKFYF